MSVVEVTHEPIAASLIAPDLVQVATAPYDPVAASASTGGSVPQIQERQQLPPLPPQPQQPPQQTLQCSLHLSRLQLVETAEDPIPWAQRARRQWGAGCFVALRVTLGTRIIGLSPPQTLDFSSIAGATAIPPYSTTANNYLRGSSNNNGATTHPAGFVGIDWSGLGGGGGGGGVYFDLPSLSTSNSMIMLEVLNFSTVPPTLSGICVIHAASLIAQAVSRPGPFSARRPTIFQRYAVHCFPNATVSQKEKDATVHAVITAELRITSSSSSSSGSVASAVGAGGNFALIQNALLMATQEHTQHQSTATTTGSSSAGNSAQLSRSTSIENLSNHNRGGTGVVVGETNNNATNGSFTPQTQAQTHQHHAADNFRNNSSIVSGNNSFVVAMNHPQGGGCSTLATHSSSLSPLDYNFGVVRLSTTRLFFPSTFLTACGSYVVSNVICVMNNTEDSILSLRMVVSDRDGGEAASRQTNNNNRISNSSISLLSSSFASKFFGSKSTTAAGSTTATAAGHNSNAANKPASSIVIPPPPPTPARDLFAVHPREAVHVRPGQRAFFSVTWSVGKPPVAAQAIQNNVLVQLQVERGTSMTTTAASGSSSVRISRSISSTTSPSSSAADALAVPPIDFDVSCSMPQPDELHQPFHYWLNTTMLTNRPICEELELPYVRSVLPVFLLLHNIRGGGGSGDEATGGGFNGSAGGENDDTTIVVRDRDRGGTYTVRGNTNGSSGSFVGSSIVGPSLRSATTLGSYAGRSSPNANTASPRSTEFSSGGGETTSPLFATTTSSSQQSTRPLLPWQIALRSNVPRVPFNTQAMRCVIHMGYLRGLPMIVTSSSGNNTTNDTVVKGGGPPPSSPSRPAVSSLSDDTIHDGSAFNGVMQSSAPAFRVTVTPLQPGWTVSRPETAPVYQSQSGALSWVGDTLEVVKGVSANVTQCLRLDLYEVNLADDDAIPIGCSIISLSTAALLPSVMRLPVAFYVYDSYSLYDKLSSTSLLLKDVAMELTAIAS